MKSRNPNQRIGTQVFQDAFLWLLFGGSMLIYDPKLQMAFRDAKDIFQFPLIATFVGIRMWSNANVPGFLKNRFNRLVLFVLLIFTWSYFRSPVPMLTLSKYANILLYAAFLLALKNYLAQHPAPHTLLYPFIITAVFSSGYAFFQYAGLDPLFHPLKHFNANRWIVAGFMGQQTLFAGAIGPIALPALFFALTSKTKTRRLLFTFSTLIITSAVFLTHTRAILLGFSAAFFIAAILLFRQRRLFRYTILSACILTLIFFLAMQLLPGFRSRMMNGITLKSNSIKARLHYWRCTYELIRVKPWIGWGLGAFQVDYPAAQIKVRTQHLDNGVRPPEIVTHPHNEYLLLLTEGGIILLTGVLMLIRAIFRLGIKNYLSSGPDKGILRLGYLLGLIVVLVDAFFSFPFYVGTSGLVAICLSAFMIYDSEEIKEGRDI